MKRSSHATRESLRGKNSLPAASADSREACPMKDVRRDKGPSRSATKMVFKPANRRMLSRASRVSLIGLDDRFGIRSLITE